MLRWFDHQLKGEDTGVLDSPVTAYVTGAGWRDLDEWPEPATALHLRSGGRANGVAGDGRLAVEAAGDDPSDRFIADPLSPVPSEGGHGPMPPRMGPKPQTLREASLAVLCYTGEPAEAPIDYVGDAEVELYARLVFRRRGLHRAAAAGGGGRPCQRKCTGR